MEKSKILFLSAATLFFGSLALLLINHQMESDNKKLTIQRDSLRDECFSKDIEIGRYEFIHSQLDTICKENIELIKQNVE